MFNVANIGLLEQPSGSFSDHIAFNQFLRLFTSRSFGGGRSRCFRFSLLSSNGSAHS